MKFSTLMILFGFMFTQQVFAQNEGKNTSECHTQNSNNNKGCEAANNTTSNQQVQKTVIKTQQKSDNVSKAAEQSSKTTVNTPKKVQKATVKTPQKTSVKTVSRRSDLVLKTQQQLNRLGFNAGPADGLMGKKTREAIKQFQKKNNTHVDGKSTSTLLDKLKKVSHK